VFVKRYGVVCPNLRTVRRVLALCALQMCCNVRSPIRDFALNVLSLEGERNFVLELRTTGLFLQTILLPMLYIKAFTMVFT
jgi:hypothetical protein